MTELEQLRADLAQVTRRANRDSEDLARVQAERDKLVTLVRDLTDPEPCWLDHHGGCQEHGYISLQPTERCPHAEAKELLASMGIELEA